jgi:hypothetical protein
MSSACSRVRRRHRGSLVHSAPERFARLADARSGAAARLLASRSARAAAITAALARLYSADRRHEQSVLHDRPG